MIQTFTLRDAVHALGEMEGGNMKMDVAIANAINPNWVFRASDIQSTPESWLQSRHDFTSSVDAAILLSNHLDLPWRVLMRRAWMKAKNETDLARSYVRETLAMLAEVQIKKER